jgi:hypothetical protein
MPQRPSKKAKVQPNAKSGPGKGGTDTDRAAQKRYEEKTARAIIGKFQGRKSI